MELKEIKSIMDLDVSTARGRAELNEREIVLAPYPHEVEMATRERAEGYKVFSTELAEMVRRNRSGISGMELEKVEHIRELFLDLAERTYTDLIRK